MPLCSATRAHGRCPVHVKYLEFHKRLPSQDENIADEGDLIEEECQVADAVSMD